MKHYDISMHTKKALAKALKNAMQKKPFQKITVSELIQECDVNRKTFYYHFQDIYDLLKWMLEEEAGQVVKHFDLLTDYEEAILFVMDYIEDNEHILNCAYDAIGRDQLKQFFSVNFYQIINSVIKSAETKAGVTLNTGYKEFLSYFYIDAITGMLIDWMKDRHKRDRATVIQYFTQTMKYSLSGILGNAQENTNDK